MIIAGWLCLRLIPRQQEEVLVTYSHSTQAVDLRLCYTMALASPVRTPDQPRRVHCATASPNATSPS